jgi:hypothetical protein
MSLKFLEDTGCFIKQSSNKFSVGSGRTITEHTESKMLHKYTTLT